MKLRWILLGALALAGCDKSSSKADKDTDAEVEEAEAKAKKAKAEAKKAEAEADKAKADAAKAIAEAAKAAAIPPAAPANPGGASPAQPSPSFEGRSPVPTVDEWNAQTREVTVNGSSALGCETKMVREWLRISCRGTHPNRGTARGVRVVSGDTGKGEFFTFSSGDVASLVFPFQQDTNVVAEFTFSTGVRNFVSEWPRGAPRPQSMGRFL